MIPNALRLALAKDVIELCAARGIVLIAMRDGVHALPRNKLEKRYPVLLARVRALRKEITYALYDMVE